MSLDTSKLQRFRKIDRKKSIARCPACAELGHDNKGEHLVIMCDGRFGCVVHPGAAGNDHRKRIYALVGDKDSAAPRCSAIRVRPAAHASLTTPVGTPINLGQLGTLGTGLSNPHATRE